MMNMSFGTFLFELCRDIWSFISNRIYKEYDYIFSIDERHGVGDSVRGDSYVNKILDSLRKERGYDCKPYIIEDRMFIWLRIPLIVEVEHLETFVDGLKSLHKAETCEIIEEDGQLFVNANLGAGPLHFNLFAFSKLLHTEQLVTIKASLNYCKINANFSVTTETGNGSLQSLRIEEFGDVYVCIAGFGCLSRILSKFITLMMKLNRRMVRNLVEFRIEHDVSLFLTGHRLPIEGKHINIASTLGKNTALDNVDIHEHQIDSEEPGTETVSNDYPSEDARVSSKLKSDIWYTNIPLLEGNAVSQDHNDSESDAENIQLEFKFSKNDIILEDVEPLVKHDVATFCFFLRSETEFLKKSGTEDTRKYLPFKNSEEFLKGLLTGEGSNFGRSVLSEELEKLPVNERTKSCNERLMKTFFKEYPNFFALTYNVCGERNMETSGFNEEIDDSAEAKVGECKNEVTVEAEDAFEINVASTEAHPNKETFNLLQKCDNVEFFKEVDQSYILQNTTRNDLECSTLPMDSITIHINENNTETTETGIQEVRKNLKHVNEKCNAFPKTLFQQKKELVDVLTVDSGDGHVIKQVQDVTELNRIQNIESILKWTLDSENNEESQCFGTKNSSYQSSEVLKSSIQRDFTTSNVVADNPLKISKIGKKRSKHQNLKDNLYSNEIKTYENEDIAHIKRNVKKGKSFNNSRERKNVNQSFVKYDYTSIDQLNAIEEAIVKCFEDPWTEKPSENTFFFTDRESNTIFDLRKRQESELAEQLNLLDDIKVEELRKETDYFEFNLDALLKEVGTQLHSTPNKIKHLNEMNSSLQSEITNLKAFDISKLVKYFFEQNPIEKFLLEQNPHPNIGEDNQFIDELKHLSFQEITIPERNENYQNFSVSPTVDSSSSIIKGKPSDLIHESLKESACLEIGKLDLSSKDSNNHTTIIDDVGTRSAHTTIDDKGGDDEFDWLDFSGSDGTSEASFSNEDILNICKSADNDPDFLENAFCGTFERWGNSPKIDFLKNNTIDTVNRQLTEASISSACKKNFLTSDNSSLKTSNIKMLNISKASTNKLNEENVVKEKFQTDLYQDNNKTPAFEEQMVTIEGKMYTVTEKDELGIKSSETDPAKFEDQDVKYPLSSFGLEKLYNKLCEDILLLISEDAESDDVSTMEDDVSEDLICITDEDMKQNNDYTDITEKLQISTNNQVEKDNQETIEESSTTELQADTVFCTIQEEDINKLTNLLREMFEEFLRQHKDADLNSFTETKIDQKTCTRELSEQSISENGNINEIDSILNTDKHSLTERQDKVSAPIYSEKLTKDNFNLWKEKSIIDVSRGISWKQALQIWGVEKPKFIFYLD